VSTKEEKVLNVRDLDTTTENFNYLEANNMTMEIIPSDKENYSIIKLKNEMKDKFTISLLTNNYGEDNQNGIWRGGTSINIDSPLGIGDRVYFSYITKPDFEFMVEGHTDNTGTPEHNLKLSQDRADAIKQYLSRHGVSKKRLDAKGYGQTRPIESNDTERGKEINRRVEINVIKDQQ